MNGPSSQLLIKWVALIQDNLIIALPIILIVIRFGVLRLAGERKAEFIKSLYSVPLDLTYAAIGIVLSALHKDFPGFQTKFQAYTNSVGLLLVTGLCVAAILYTALNRWLDKLAKNFQVAMEAVSEQLRNPGFQWTTAPFGTLGRVFWSVRYLAGIVTVLFIEFATSYFLLKFIANAVM